MARRKEREIAFQFLFTWEFQQFLWDQFESQWKHFLEAEEYVDLQISFEYAKEITHGVILEKNNILDLLSTYWQNKVVGKVEKVVCMLCVYEMLFAKELLPKNIAINEAITLAKKYGRKESSKFVNGILDMIKG